MAIKSESKGNSQSSGHKEKAQSPNPVIPTGKQRENVDALVTSFLAELTEISSEITSDGNTATPGISVDDPGNPGADEALVNPQPPLQEETFSPTDPDSESIDSEIEQSLDELESLKSAAPLQMADPIPDEEPESPEPAASSHVEADIEPTITPPPPAPQEHVLKGRKFSIETTVLPLLALWRSKRIRILSGAVLAGIIGISALYFLWPDKDTPSAVDKGTVSRPGEPEQASEETGIALISSKDSSSPTEPEQGSRPGGAGSASIQQSSRSKSPSSSAERAVEDGAGGSKSGERKSRSSTAGPTTSRSTPTTDIDSISSRTKTAKSEESSRRTAADLRSAAGVPTKQTTSETPSISPSDAEPQTPSVPEKTVPEAIDLTERTPGATPSTPPPIVEPQATSVPDNPVPEAIDFPERTPGATASAPPPIAEPQATSVPEKTVPEAIDFPERTPGATASALPPIVEPQTASGRENTVSEAIDFPERTPGATASAPPPIVEPQATAVPDNPVPEAINLPEQTPGATASAPPPIAEPSRNGSAAENNAASGDTPPENASVKLKPRIPVKPEVITKVMPEYPAIARNQKITGTVEVEVDIDERGNVVRAKALSGPMLLYSASERALMKWKFKPASIDGIDMASTTRVLLVFSPQ